MQEDQDQLLVKRSRTPLRKRFSQLSHSGWFTHQHGGWSMTFIPLLAGCLLSGFNWWQFLLLAAWLSAFLFFDALGLWVAATQPLPARGARPAGKRRTQRGRRFLAPLTTWASLAAIGGFLLVYHEPRLLWFATIVIPCFAVALGQMWRGSARSFLARCAAIGASCTLTPIAYLLGNTQSNWQRMWIATVVLFAYFVGTIAYVKTMIRERESLRWLRFSIGYHLALTVVAIPAAAMGLVSWWVPTVWLILGLRAWGMPYLSRRIGKPIRPAVFGSTEFFFSALVVISVLLP